MPEAPLWSVTWEDAHRQSRLTTFTDWDDQKIDPSAFAVDPLTVFRKYSFAVARAIAAGHAVPKDVRAEYEARCLQNGLTPEHASHAAYAPAVTAPLVNKKGKPFSWSYSRLADFDPELGGCPRRYAANSFYCTVPYSESEAQKLGNRGHKACEQALKGERVDEPEFLTDAGKYINLFAKQRDLGAKVLAEQEITLTENMQLTSWFAKDAWFRMKLDVTVEKDRALKYYDWKYGAKVKDAVDQLKICCGALSVAKPHIENFTGKLIWTKHSTVTGGCEMTRAEAQAVWAETLGRVERMKEAWRTENFPGRPSGLCKWGGPNPGQCPVYDDCPYARRK